MLQRVAVSVFVLFWCVTGNSIIAAGMAVLVQAITNKVMNIPPYRGG